jgi:hypothetical protein
MPNFEAIRDLAKSLRPHSFEKKKRDQVCNICGKKWSGYGYQQYCQKHGVSVKYVRKALELSGLEEGYKMLTMSENVTMRYLEGIRIAKHILNEYVDKANESREKHRLAREAYEKYNEDRISQGLPPKEYVPPINECVFGTTKLIEDSIRELGDVGKYITEKHLLSKLNKKEKEVEKLRREVEVLRKAIEPTLKHPSEMFKGTNEYQWLKTTMEEL